MAVMKSLSGGVLLAVGNVCSALSTFAVLSVVIGSVQLKTFGAISLLLTSVSICQVLFNTQSWQGLLNSAVSPVASLLRRCLAVDVGMACVGATVLWLTYVVFPAAMPTGFAVPAILHLIIFNVALTPTGTFIAVIRQEGKFGWQGLVDIACSVIKMLLAFGWVRGSESLWPIVVTLVLPECVRWCGYFAIALPRLKGPDETESSGHRVPLRSIYGFSIWGMLTEIVHLPTAQIDKLLVSAVLGLEALAMWDILKRCATAVVQVTTVVNQMLFPYFVSVRTTCSTDKLALQCLKHCGLLAGVLFFLYGMATLALPVWFPLAFHVDHPGWGMTDIQSTFGILALVMTFVLGATPVHPLFLSLGYAPSNFKISLMGSVAFFCLSYLLLPRFHLYGASLAIFGSDGFVILTKIYLLRLASEEARTASSAAP